LLIAATVPRNSGNRCKSALGLTYWQNDRYRVWFWCVNLWLFQYERLRSAHGPLVEFRQYTSVPICTVGKS